MMNSYVRKNGQIVLGVIMTITFGAIILLNSGIIDFPRWQLWSVFFISFGLGLLSLWTRKITRSWVLLPGCTLLFAGGAGFGTDNWWHYQRTLRDIVDMWPIMLIFFGAIIVISRNISHEQQHIIKK